MAFGGRMERGGTGALLFQPCPPGTPLSGQDGHPWGECLPDDISFVPSLCLQDISQPVMGHGLDTIYTLGWSRVKITPACLAA